MCFIVSVAVCILLTLIGYPGIIDWFVKSLPASLEGGVRFVGYLSFMDHFYEMSKGVFVFRDVLYFLSVIAAGLMLTGLALRSKRA